MHWIDVDTFAAIDAYLGRLNDRAARDEGPEAKLVTIHHLAPILVATMATLGNPGVASFLGLGRGTIAPLTPLYTEMMAALGDRGNDVLGKQFVKDSRALLDELRHGRTLSGESQRDTRRDEKSGLPLALFTADEE
ncbi:hypothetical protein H9P43_006321 [Blastocladiella emersonii ATCC 22665]|nr:hypothetical protein H9P43_006321 [Blastocladiella emersonii ATCC 22665]